MVAIMSAQTFTESQILTRYLLPPSSLPTIIPYNTFLSLLPPSLSNSISTDPAFSSAVRKLYNDLHFQRTITLDIVSSNIERECARSGALKAKLAQSLQRELVASGHAPGVKRKRQDEDKKAKRAVSAPVSVEANAESEEEEEIEDSEDERNSSKNSSPHFEPASTDRHLQPSTTNPNQSSTSPPPHRSHNPLLSPRTTLIDHALLGQFGSTLPSTAQRYHSPTSLLQSMSTAISDLESEITSIETESDAVLKQMEETVGSLSDLRYGKFARVSGGGGEEDGLEGSVVVALRDVTEKINGKMRRQKGQS